jgi:hypothetical protein
MRGPHYDLMTTDKPLQSGIGSRGCPGRLKLGCKRELGEHALAIPLPFVSDSGPTVDHRPGAKVTAMTAWIIGFALFYTLAIAYLGFEMWRALLVDHNGNVVPVDKAQEAFQGRRQLETEGTSFAPNPAERA